jgi:hypothetical protein
MDFNFMIGTRRRRSEGRPAMKARLEDLESEVLVHLGPYQVYRTHGSLHVRLGTITLELSPQEFHGVVEALVEAAVRMDVRDCLAQTPWLQNLSTGTVRSAATR